MSPANSSGIAPETPQATDLRDRSDAAGDDVTVYRDRPSDDGKKGQADNREDAPEARSSLGNFAEEDLEGGHPQGTPPPRP